MRSLRIGSRRARRARGPGLAHPALAPALLATVLVGCGGGGGGGSDTFTAAAVGPGGDPGRLAFSWRFDGSAARFRLEVNPDGISGFAPADVDGDGDGDPDDEVGGGRRALDLPLPVHLTDFAYALYQLVALDADGSELDRSRELPIDGLTVERLIGYLKASNTRGSDAFGSAVALSADGSTLAVGAIRESSGATGIDGNQVDDCNSAPGMTNCVPSSGAVYVFRRDSAGSWTQEAYVKASNPGRSDHFGVSVALSAAGDTLAVGAADEDSDATGVADPVNDDNDFADGAGAVYVFDRDAGGTWSQTAYVKALNTGVNDRFGRALALSDDGDTLAVGARFEDGDATGSADPAADDNDNAPASGAVYVYRRPFGDWIGDAYLKASNTGDGDRFGTSVDLASGGARLAVGASGEDGGDTGVTLNDPDDTETGNGATDAGAAYVFLRSNIAMDWSQLAYLKASNTGMGDHFGSAIAISGDESTIAVGARFEDGDILGAIMGTPGNGITTDGAPGSGAVYVFASTGFGWDQEAYVKASNTDPADSFGERVALSGDGDTLVVGASGEDSDATGVNGVQGNELQEDSGAAYVLERAAANWSQRSYVKAPNTGAKDGFGGAVDISGSGRSVVVGADREDGDATGIADPIADDNDDAPDAGAAYLY